MLQIVTNFDKRFVKSQVKFGLFCMPLNLSKQAYIRRYTLARTDSYLWLFLKKPKIFLISGVRIQAKKFEYLSFYLDIFRVSQIVFVVNFDALFYWTFF